MLLFPGAVWLAIFYFFSLMQYFCMFPAFAVAGAMSWLLSICFAWVNFLLQLS